MWFQRLFRARATAGASGTHPGRREPLHSPDRYGYDQLGSYHPGLFYSRSASGVPWEPDLMMQSVGADLQSALRKLTLIHETCHLVHDLSLGVCMASDYLKDEWQDELFEYLSVSTRSRIVQCPLVTPNGVQQLTDVSDDVDFIQKRERLVDELLFGPPQADLPADLKRWFPFSPRELKGLTTRALIEGVVSVQTLRAINGRITSDGEVAFLRALHEDLRVLPEQLPELYGTARDLYDNTVGRLLRIGSTYKNDQWPEQYDATPRCLSDLGFLFIADIAMHIPPFSVILLLVNMGKSALHEFSPTYRFCKAIASVMKMGKISDWDRKHYDDFYKQMFDEIAVACTWPAFRGTDEAWQSFLLEAKANRKRQSDGYRYRVLVERSKTPYHVVSAVRNGDPLGMCHGQLVPVFHWTPTGFKILAATNPIFDMPLAPVWELYARKVDEWRDVMPWTPNDEQTDISLRNELSFLGEVLRRWLSRAFYKAVMYRDYLRCPFASEGCHLATENCLRLTDLSAIPRGGCVLRDYLQSVSIDTDNIKWSPERLV